MSLRHIRLKAEQVFDVQPKLAAWGQLLATESTNKNDPHDARSSGHRSSTSAKPKAVRAEDHATVAKLWAKRQRDLARTRNKVACRLHSQLCHLVAGDIGKEIYVNQAVRMLGNVEPDTVVAVARLELAQELLEDALVKISSVLSDIHGVSGRAMHRGAHRR